MGDIEPYEFDRTNKKQEENLYTHQLFKKQAFLAAIRLTGKIHSQSHRTSPRISLRNLPSAG